MAYTYTYILVCLMSFYNFRFLSCVKDIFLKLYKNTNVKMKQLS